MVPDSLSALQKRLLRVLAGLEPPWTLTGGGALAGVHLGHRTTRDLDLFWRDRGEVGDAVEQAVQVLRRDGLEVTTLRTSPAFAQLRVSDGTDVCIVDLVAEPFGPIYPPQRVEVAGATIWVDGKDEILINKLTALLGRVELRDLQDVQALLSGGCDLLAALREAPRKDGGFSALTLAWVLETFDAHALARSLGWIEPDAVAIDRFRRDLIDRLTRTARPD
jgi:hypothetical protein